MTCERIEGLLSAYLEGALTGVERAEVAAHLAACPGCSGLVDLLKATTGALATFSEVDPSAELMADLHAIPASQRERRRRFRPVFDFLTRPALQPVYAAFTVLFIALSFVFFHPGGRGIRKQIDLQFHKGIGTVEKLYAGAGTLKGEIGSLATTVVKSFNNLDLLKGGEEKP
jgi:predicted anti-sigma-YlaC factor YlaD